MKSHFQDLHEEECFKCKRCRRALFLSVQEAVDHCKYEHSDKNPLDTDRIVFPEHLEKILCVFCDPAEIFIGKSLGDLQMDLFSHLEMHERIHKGKDSIIESKVQGFHKTTQVLSLMLPLKIIWMWSRIFLENLNLTFKSIFVSVYCHFFHNLTW